MGFSSLCRRFLFVASISLTFVGAAKAETILIMFDALGCPYCELWKEQIGPIYPKTPEAQIAPLVTINIHDPLPEGITLNSAPVYTPTFVLVHNGVEVSRIPGYPGEDFFWGLLDRMLNQLEEETTEGRT